MPDLSTTLASLRADYGLDFSRVRLVLTALAEGATLSRLVMDSGLPRRDVEVILRELAPFLKSEKECQQLASGELVVAPFPGEPSLTARMDQLATALPPSRWRLDHVPATPETMARRAQYLADTYELDGASVLCLGDHDLTSLAVGLAAPGAELAVVDIDEPILDYIDGSAERLGRPVTAAWADFRLALPASLVGTADLVFTDPPYTTEGMRLFLRRGLEALRPSGHERLAFCFGTGERHLVKALEVQALLGELRLALEAMLPGFNHYTGAEAIGAKSDLYICRPTKGAKVGEAARSQRSRKRSPRIYTRGAAAEEASARVLPAAVVAAALAAAGVDRPLLIGEGWDAAAVGGAPATGVDREAVADGGASVAGVDREVAVALPDFFGRVAGWATAARPGPFPFTGTPVVNTYPDHGGAALRTLLLAAPERAVLIVPRRDLPDPDLVAAAYDLTAVPAGPGGDPAVVLATRHDRAPADNAEAVLRHVLLHPGAKIVNAWRDGLLAVARDEGRAMTKNEARARIGADSLDPAFRRLRIWELPLSSLRKLVGEILSRSAAA